jgi:PadR family transcriptional regulator, regulatory protein PadR
VRRKTGSLVPLELAVCTAAMGLRERGVTQFHGYLLAKEIKNASDAKLLTAYGTLYRALGRLEQMGLMTSEWEDPQIPAAENRPRRRLYAITHDGQKAVADAASEAGTSLLATRRVSLT